MAKKSGITLKIEGFEKLLNDIEAAGGKMKSATNEGMKESAKIMDSELKAKMQGAGVESGLISRMDAPEVEWNGNTCKASIGYKKGSYNPKHPADGYKVAFLNYGTAKRYVKADKLRVFFNGQWHTLKKERGEIAGSHFIETAKKTAKPKIKKKQQQTLEEILKGLRT